MSKPQPYTEPLVYDMEIRDLPPDKNPKGGSPSTGQGETKKPKSDQLRAASAMDYFKAHAHPVESVNGHNGWSGFIRSNLFTAIVIFLLGQVILLALNYVATYNQTSKLAEWRVGVDLTLKRMDDWGTIHGHYADERQDSNIIELQQKTKSISEIESNLAQLVSSASERNNQQDRQIAEVSAQLSQMVPTLAEIRAKLNFVADLLDERTKNKK